MKDSKEIKVVCIPCGVQYLTDKQKGQGGVVTANKGICGLCGKEEYVVPIRHYNNLQKPNTK